ncbi:MAG TPA: thioredoxin family protein [Polyangiaceae bacterium]|nr:thioredoxin family protein [Polyangiaceae bacterium]
MPAPASIVFVENDYPRALAEARARHVPLFVDAWATWCHTCLSMKSYVFPDPALRPFASRFVWLSLDTEREENAAVVSRLGVRVLPTLYVLEAAHEQPVLAWPGSLTAAELTELLNDAELAARQGDAGGEAATALLRADQAVAAGHVDDAVVAYRASLAAAPASWPRRPRAVDGLVTALADRKDLAACVTVGADEVPKLPPGTALADVLRSAMACAEDLPTSAPERGRLADLAAAGERVALDVSQPILADDRSDLYDYVVHALRDLGRTGDALRVARSWAAFLEDQAARAADPAGRAVFDAHRLLAYLALDEPERALPMLAQSEHDFPADYNPPARLATALLHLKRYDDALAAVKRSLERAYGPRKLRLWSLEADILEAKKDRSAARRALAEALAYAKTIPLTGGYPKLRDALEKRAAKP